MTKKLHIVSFDVPYPPIYGGVIDVFYKLKALSALGIEIYLHVFEKETKNTPELLKYCKKVYHYKRLSSVRLFFSITPYIVNSRKNKHLIENLKNVNAPILFEGLHTTSALLKTSFKNRKIFIRAHNVEHAYYFGLAKSEKSFFKKMFFYSEGYKLKGYQKIVNKANNVLCISPLEQVYFKEQFNKKAIYLPVFHQNTFVKNISKKGKFAFYHGDFRVADNLKAAYFLIGVFNKLDYRLVIAGNTENKKLIKIISKTPNISFKKLDTKNTLSLLFEEAHINILPTFQKTGIKLKLINTLYSGRFCLVNNEMVLETGLESLCLQANTQNEFRKAILEISKKDYLLENTEKRTTLLKPFDNKINAQKIIDLLYS